MVIHGLHHNARRRRDSAATRTFYEDFPGLPLAEAFEIVETKSGRKTNSARGKLNRWQITKQPA